MTHTALTFIAAAALLVAPASAQAFDFGVGIEGAGTFTTVGNATSTSGGGGILLEERLGLPLIELTLWEDVQTPFSIQDGPNGGTSSFIPVDLGLRLGLAFPLLHPFLGILANDNILSSETPGNVAASGNFWGLGGDVGLDLCVAFLRFGLELRAYWAVTPEAVPALEIAPNGAVILQALLSARASF